ncbi:MAG: toll/interleukin-1 receptor domain-containing protein [Phyllobacteriaceae bacterium]|nr:toll/interleukin-1 receptor domain-containing protein [Phyllobacteriaceae bacterium]
MANVFAQYKDMPPGSNFIAEMQRAVSKNMGKFSPIYSPDYPASDICQDEWNAAYNNMDRGGRRRLIVGFLVRPTVLKPLQKQICYVPLYAVPGRPKARQAILDALAADGTKHLPERPRGEARRPQAPTR